MLHELIEDTYHATQAARGMAEAQNDKSAWRGYWHLQGVLDGLRGWEEMPPETEWLQGSYRKGHRFGRDERAAIAVENWLAK